MMRVLRSSIYRSTGDTPVTTILRDVDTEDTLESVRYGIFIGEPRDSLKVFDLFQMPTGSQRDAIHEALRRANRAKERDMALLYYCVIQRFGILNDRGTIIMDKPAPLSPREMRSVFQQIAMHPHYQGYSVVGYSHKLDKIELRDGSVV